MNFKKLNEELEALLENNIDPKFRAVEKEARDKAYKELSKEDLDIEETITIKFMGSDKDFKDSKALYNKITPILAKLANNKVKLPNNYKAFIIPIVSDKYSQFRSSVYELEYNKKYGCSVYSQGLFIDYVWKPLHDKKLLGCDFYLAYGPINTKRLERRSNRNYYDNSLVNNVWDLDYDGRKDFTKWDKWDVQHYRALYDKSGYPLDRMRDHLMKRLKEYKRKKGAYTAQVDELQNNIFDLDSKIKNIMVSSDITDLEGARHIKILLNNYHSFCKKANLYIQELENPDLDEREVNEYYRDAIDALNRVNKNIDKS